MALKVVEEKCQFSDDMTSGTIVIESDTPRDKNGFSQAMGELEPSIELHNMAIIYGSKRMGIARLNGTTTTPYPVNANGEMLYEVPREVPTDDPRRVPHAYRVDVPVVRPMTL